MVDVINDNIEPAALNVILSRIAVVETLITERAQLNKERLNAMEKSMEIFTTSLEKAMDKTSTSIAQRFETVNEFRATLSDQATRMLTRSEWATEHRALSEKLDEVGRRVATIEERSVGKREATGQVSNAVVFGVTVGGFIIWLMTIVGGIAFYLNKS